MTQPESTLLRGGELKVFLKERPGSDYLVGRRAEITGK